MSDHLADRLKQLSQQHAKEQQEQRESANFQERVNKFISDQSRPEFERLLIIIKARVEQLNPNIGDLPQFQIVENGRTIQQGNAAAYLLFEKPIMNAPQNVLAITFGPLRNAMYFLSAPPDPRRYRLHAAASDSLDQIVWLGDLGELSSEQLAEFIIENLTTYYLEHKPR